MIGLHDEKALREGWCICEGWGWDCALTPSGIIVLGTELAVLV